MVWYDDVTCINTVKLNDFIYSMSDNMTEIQKANVTFQHGLINFNKCEPMIFLMCDDRTDELKQVFGSDSVLRNNVIEKIDKTYYYN